MEYFKSYIVVIILVIKENETSLELLHHFRTPSVFGLCNPS